MPVRLRITILFSLTVCIILLAVCSTVYYMAYSSRLNFIKTRLLNRASYTNGLLSQAEVFSSGLVARLDTSVTGLVRSKEMQVYDHNNKQIYSYSDVPADYLVVDTNFLSAVREEGSIFFNQGNKEGIAVYYPSSELLVISATRDEPGKKYLSQLKTILWLGLVGGILISFAGGYFLSGRLLQPVTRIADEVNEISARNLTRRIRTGRSRDEWFYLSQTLNRLLDRLHHSFEVQGRFIANASHELCTPLTSISSQLEVSLLRHRDPEQYRAVINSTLQDVLRLNQLTQGLLEVARASGSPAGLEIELVRIDEVLFQMTAEITKTNSDWTVQLGFDEMPAEEKQLLVAGNSGLLYTAISNIVTNACKYSPDQQANINLEIEAGSIIISVKDNGPGIESTETETIFLPFYRAPNTSTKKGFGLGLSLSSHIIQLHNGRINVQSAPGRGSVFSIVLPQASERSNDATFQNAGSQLENS